MRMLFAGLLAAAVLAFPADFALGHSGGLDGCGCHAGSRPYHCHRPNCSACPWVCQPTRRPKPGRLVVKAIPRARVYINGKFVGVSPTKRIRVDGSAKVRLEHRILGHHEFTVDVPYDEVVEQQIRW